LRFLLNGASPAVSVVVLTVGGGAVYLAFTRWAGIWDLLTDIERAV